jgi:hypothetical protein
VSAPAEAKSEYSRGSGAFRRVIASRRQAAPHGSPEASTERASGTGAVVLVAIVGALLVLVAQFTALYDVRVVTSSIPVKTVGTGANHGWAALPIALVCLVLAFAVYRYGNRGALLGLATLGIATLVIALAADLPDVHATGLIGSSASQFERATNRPAAGLYLETLGSVLLLVSGGVGFLMLAPPRPPRAATATASATATTPPPSPPAGQPSPEPEDWPVTHDEAASGPPDGTPAGPKNPLSLRETGRRKWSAS